jgi:hypothetical protein
MDTPIEIPLNSLRYRFRKLTWREEVRLDETRKPDEDSRRSYLALALIEVVRGEKVLVVTSADSKLILDQLSGAVLHRVWMVYTAALPDSRFFSTKGIYTAPEARKFQKLAVETTEEPPSALHDAEQKFGLQEVKESRDVERKILADAKKRGVARPIKGTP